MANANNANIMRNIKVDSVTLNIGAGITAEGVEKAILLLNRLSGKTAVKTFGKKRIPTWKIRPGLPIGARITLRGKEAVEILKRCITAVDNELKQKSFTENGFSFGVKEYVDVPGMKYDPKIGIIGFDVIVSLKRPGYRVARRKLRKAHIGTHHKITAEDAWSWAQTELGVKPKVEE